MPAARLAVDVTAVLGAGLPSTNRNPNPDCRRTSAGVLAIYTTVSRRRSKRPVREDLVPRGARTLGSAKLVSRGGDERNGLAI
jgi:hypothetical protein